MWVCSAPPNSLDTLFFSFSTYVPLPLLLLLLLLGLPQAHPLF
jgi:hypothetical protein